MRADRTGVSEAWQRAPADGNGENAADLHLQHWFDLSGPAAGEALYKSVSMRAFVGIDLSRQPAPNETTVCKFRHLLGTHELGRALFEQVGRHLSAQSLKVSRGMIVDATINN